MRPGTAAAIKILEEVAFDLGLTMLLWHGPTRTETAKLLKAAKVEFVVRARKLGIYIDTIAEVLGCDRGTVMVLSDPALKMRKNASQRHAAARRRARKKADQVSGWNVPVFHRPLPAGLYGTGQLVDCRFRTVGRPVAVPSGVCGTEAFPNYLRSI